ncbi:hypothetical protein F422_gp032 [Staphylococcus phage SA11]|uniref:Uncharacterized protein n=1 Tax=Staphylococcus phage SA11 TaxID=2927988 RepID=I7CCK2_9CAUD|nr:hypothetical protein F422_gp032 [Staphylococcus phage SA11]QQO38037.1 hypothetical protein LSA2308_00016 [Staphylococcus phage LSA2308]USZ62816.1 hypothetical protein LSA2311_orf00008 [Staphylococcus phage LSA2311]UVD42393.1 hypothetical protein [Staphylococcus phage vB_SauM-V1SA19]WBF47837.1 hypothetical protein SSP49_12 [Staphylococcus phage SSP49]WJZ48691.1 hypothetical protein SAC_60 [Staphylococcus phage SAC]
MSNGKVALIGSKVLEDYNIYTIIDENHIYLKDSIDVVFNDGKVLPIYIDSVLKQLSKDDKNLYFSEEDIDISKLTNDEYYTVTKK